MAKKPQAHEWYGRPILDARHAHDLEQASALFEFKHGMQRAQAEEAAYQQYQKEHHRKAAAHHLHGLKASRAVGNEEAAKMHSAQYQAHMRSAGLDPMGAVPPEVAMFAPEPHKAYDFNPHPADEWASGASTTMDHPKYRKFEDLGVQEKLHVLAKTLKLIDNSK